MAVVIVEADGGAGEAGSGDSEADGTGSVDGGGKPARKWSWAHGGLRCATVSRFGYTTSVRVMHNYIYRRNGGGMTKSISQPFRLVEVDNNIGLWPLFLNLWDHATKNAAADKGVACGFVFVLSSMVVVVVKTAYGPEMELAGEKRIRHMPYHPEMEGRRRRIPVSVSRERRDLPRPIPVSIDQQPLFIQISDVFLTSSPQRVVRPSTVLCEIYLRVLPGIHGLTRILTAGTRGNVVKRTTCLEPGTIQTDAVHDANTMLIDLAFYTILASNFSSWFVRATRSCRQLGVEARHTS
ncbi:hypothetical protein CPB85DRAFT_1457215 [Mucidula mucida]|nr:hypothetical protein CPB85DRAFT_1457215 [Mucidula mucida]